MIHVQHTFLASLDVEQISFFEFLNGFCGYSQSNPIIVAYNRL